MDTIPIWGSKTDGLGELIKKGRSGVSVIGLPAFTAPLRTSLRRDPAPSGRYARSNGIPSHKDVAEALGWTHFQFDRLFNKATNTICPAAFKAFCEVFGVTAHDWIWSADIFWDRITSITPAGEQEVYDLPVEPSRTFVASGVIVRNSLLSMPPRRRQAHYWRTPQWATA